VAGRKGHPGKGVTGEGNEDSGGKGKRKKNLYGGGSMNAGGWSPWEERGLYLPRRFSHGKKALHT